MAIFGGYTGARVAPLPAGFMGAAMTSATNLQKGLAGLGEGIGDALKQYGKNKEERETYEGLIAGEAQRAAENKPYYDRLSGKEAPPEARELAPEDAANYGAEMGITHRVTEDAGQESPSMVTRPGPPPDVSASFLSDIAGGKKLYDKFLSGDASRADLKAIYANLSMYNAKGEHLMKQFQMKQMFAQDAMNRGVYNPIQGAETREAVPPIERFVSDNVPAERILQLIGKYRDGGGNQVDPASGQTMGELAIGQNVDDEYLLETLKGFGDFDISQYMPNELSRKRQYRDESTHSDADLNTQATGLHSRIMELNKYATGEKRQPRSYDGGQPMRNDEIGEKIISLSDEYEGIRTEQDRRKGVDDYVAKRKAIEGDRVSRIGPLQEEMSSWSQYFSGAGKPRPSQSDEAKQTRGTMRERQRELLAEAKSVNQQSKDALAKLATDNPEQHADAFPQPVQPGSQPDQPPMPHIKDIDLGYTELLPQPDKVTPGEVREMTTAERKAQDIKSYVAGGGLLNDRAMAAIDAKYPEAKDVILQYLGNTGIGVIMQDGKIHEVIKPDTKDGRESLTEFEGKAFLNLSRMQSSQREIERITQGFDPTSSWQKLKPILLNEVTPAKWEEYQAAMYEWTDAMLRQTTGAQATEAEIERNVLTYFPQPGQGKGKREQSARMRVNVMNTISRMLPPEYQGAGTQPGGQATQAPPGHRAFDKTGTENK